MVVCHLIDVCVCVYVFHVNSRRGFINPFLGTMSRVKEAGLNVTVFETFSKRIE